MCQLYFDSRADHFQFSLILELIVFFFRRSKYEIFKIDEIKSNMKFKKQLSLNIIDCSSLG